jgi:hypothetical protein
MGLASKRKKSKNKKKNKAPDTISAGKTVALMGEAEWQGISKYIFGFLLLVYFVCYFLKLWESLGDAHFWADENVHAYISSIITETRRLPAQLPDDIYGEFVWSYPPLFHIMAAGIISVAGFAALKYVNLTLLFIFFICLYYLMHKYYGHTAALITCLLISLSPALAINSVRFMTDMLSMILLFFSFFFFLKAIESNHFLAAAFSGLATGLLLLSKQTGIVVFSFYGLFLLWFIWKDKSNAKTVFTILSVALVVYIPYLIWALSHRIEVFSFLSFFLGDVPDWAIMAVKSFRRYESSVKEFAYLFYKGNGLTVTVALLIPVLYMIKSRARELPYNLLFSLLIYLMLAMSVWHITNTRHTLSLLPVLAFLTGYGISRMLRQKLLINLTIIFLFAVSAYSLYKMPNWRQQYNAPDEFVKLAQMIKEDPASDDRTLVIYAFDTLMYARKPVIWPYPNLKDIPIDLLEKQTAQKFFDLLKKYRIKYILIDTRFILNTDRFNGRSYPLFVMRNCETLDRQGRLKLQSMSESKRFILLKVS